MIADNLAIIRRKIADAASKAGRSPDEVRVVAAAKSQGSERIRAAVAAGIRIIGHNYVQEAALSADPAVYPDVQVHMIGHLQKNKANKAVELFDMIQTVDNIELASALDRKAAQAGRAIRVMIQVNLSGEQQKSGIDAANVAHLAEAIRSCSTLKLDGLMTMPPFFDDPDRARPYFARLKDLQQRLMAAGVLERDMGELSMGMTGDFDVAVEEGATLVRIGTALFGARPV